jgi:hypothetical protein
MRVRETSRSLLTARIALAGVLAALFCAAAGADKGANEGAYVEPGGARHEWRVERTHSLTWDGKPYLPAGVVFHSQFLKSPSDDSLARDAAELERLKSGGVQDIWVEPGRGLLETKVSDTQKLIDALEARGFRYGLRIGVIRRRFRSSECRCSGSSPDSARCGKSMRPARVRLSTRWSSLPRTSALRTGR